MDGIVSDATHLDADVLLPPRKRLLAGLKRQSCSETTSQCSNENNPSLSPSPSPSSQAPLTEFDIRLNSLWKSYKNGSNMSPGEIAKAAGSAAVAAAKLAEAVRATAEEKAAIAAKAVDAAKNALDLVASISEEMGSRDEHQRKNKLKKQVPVQVLYKKYQSVENYGKDGELPQRLRQVVNSCPRISRTSRTSPDSDAKGHRHKKMKISPTNEKNGVANGPSVADGNLTLSLARNDAIEIGVGCDGSDEETLSVKMDDKVLKSSKCDEIEVSSCEVKSSHPKEKTPRPLEDMGINGRKRGRIKQKKLPLSICSLKDQANPKEPNVKKSRLSRAREDKSTTHHVSSLSMEPSSGNVKPVEVAPTWKCQDFQVPRCIKQDKVVQS